MHAAAAAAANGDMTPASAYALGTTVPENAPVILTAEQRYALFYNTGTSRAEALAMSVAEMTPPRLLSLGVTPHNMRAASVGPMCLKRLGAGRATDLVLLGFRALHLADPRWAAEAVAAHGAGEVVDAFLKTPADAVCIAATANAQVLNVGVPSMLRVCAGAPTEAAAVLEQLPRGAALHGVPISVLLDTGLRAGALLKVGYGIANIAEQTGAAGDDLARLGFTLRL
jgi:hypothetical protein